MTVTFDDLKFDVWGYRTDNTCSTVEQIILVVL
jgi:hypothetical protein